MRDSNLGANLGGRLRSTTESGRDMVPFWANEEEHDLDAHIVDLKKIDSVRQASTTLRGQGNKALASQIEGKIFVESQSPYEYAKSIRVAIRVSRAYEAPPDLFLKKLIWLDSLSSLGKQSRSVLLAAESMRALVATNQHTLSKGVMRCWYWITRELYTVSKPDWSVGGARAGVAGRASGFTTSQCVHAVMDLAESLLATAKVCSYLSNVSDALAQLDGKGIPTEWRAEDRKRIASSCDNTLKRQIPSLAFRLAQVSKVDGDSVANYVNVLLPRELERTLIRVLKDFDSLEDEINRFRGGEERADERLCAESAMGHSIGFAAIRKGKACCEKALAAIRSKDDPWGKVAKYFSEAGVAVRGGLAASRKYLSTIIDEQLAASSLAEGNQWEPAELAFAANAYLAMRRDEPLHDIERLRNAALLIQRSFAPDGTVLIRRIYHVDAGASYRVRNHAVMAAAAEFLRTMKMPINGPFVDRLLPSLLKHAMRQGDEIQGWQAEFPTSKRGPDMLETACAVEALAAVNRLLDDGINQIILEHFSVKYPVPGGVELDGLFYPDYGLAQPVKKGSELEFLVRPSCAITFQRLRAHVNRTGLKPPLHSLVLHGPAGTGKTTLVEALAQTCDVPMVEVTPSDLAKNGEAELERRARTVFEALSLLTHVVILFDEFDPILRRRDKTGKDAFTYFSFLTPGMLPKLKNLSEKAKKQSVAYILNTNLLGTLDEAAVRKGRFDEKVAVFPPDPLSRLGRLMVLTNSMIKEGRKGYTIRRDARLRKFVYKTGGLGMPALTEKGWFIKDFDSDHHTPLNYIFGVRGHTQLPDMPSPEDRFDWDLRGMGESAEQEAKQWAWLYAWDTFLEQQSEREELNVMDMRPMSVSAIAETKPIDLREKHEAEETHTASDRADAST